MTPHLERPSTRQQRRRNRALAVPNAEGSPLEGFVEVPADGAPVDRLTEMAGWHAWEGRPVAAVALELDGRVVGGARMGVTRDDVVALQGDEGYAGTGWCCSIDLRAVHAPTVTLRAVVYPGREHPGVRLDPITVSVLGTPTLYEDGSPIPPPDEVRGRLDVPEDGTRVALGPLVVRGWARSTSAPIATVELLANGTPLGKARICMDRADVAGADPAVDAPISGFEQLVDLGVLPASTSSVVLTARPRALDGTTAELTVELASSAPPLRVVARPPTSDGPPAGPLSVLVVTHDLAIGGAQLWLLEALQRIGAGRTVPCTVVAFGSGPLHARLVELGIEVHVTSPIPVHDAVAYEGRLSELWSWLGSRSPTVALVNTFRAFAGADLAERHGIPVVWAIHESWTEPLIWAFDHPGVAVDETVRAAAAGALAGAAAVLFESEATRALYEARAPGRTVLVPFGVDSAALDQVVASTSRDAARRSLGLGLDGTILLSVGTIEPRKCQSLLTEAFAEVARRRDDVTLALVGDLATPYSAALRAFVERAGLAGRVLVEPVVPDVATWYRAADLFVCASDVESLPRSVIDAMCTGLPVVATGVFGLAELLTDGETGLLFEPNDLESAVGALERALSMEPSALAAIGARGCALVHRDHDAAGYATTLGALLRGLHADPAARLEDLLDELATPVVAPGVTAGSSGRHLPGR